MRIQCDVVVFDIETIERPEPDWHCADKLAALTEWEAKKRDYIDRTYAKQETKARHLDNMLAEKERRLSIPTEKWKFSPAGAEIVAIAWREGSLGSGGHIDWSPPLGRQDEELVCVTAFINHLNHLYQSTDYTLCGFNSSKFDVPVLCRVITQYGLKLDTKPTDWNSIDITKMPLFREQKQSQDYWCQQFGLEADYSTSGADVAEMYKKDKEEGTKKVLEYCKSDVVKSSFLIDVNLSMFNLWS